jgi:hypothetical protein
MPPEIIKNGNSVKLGDQATEWTPLDLRDRDWPRRIVNAA